MPAASAARAAGRSAARWRRPRTAGAGGALLPCRVVPVSALGPAVWHGHLGQSQVNQVSRVAGASSSPPTGTADCRASSRHLPVGRVAHLGKCTRGFQKVYAGRSLHPGRRVRPTLPSTLFQWQRHHRGRPCLVPAARDVARRARGRAAAAAQLRAAAGLQAHQHLQHQAGLPVVPHQRRADLAAEPL